jgi:hypothetical protein
MDQSPEDLAAIAQLLATLQSLGGNLDDRQKQAMPDPDSGEMAPVTWDLLAREIYKRQKAKSPAEPGMTSEETEEQAAGAPRFGKLIYALDAHQRNRQ